MQRKIANPIITSRMIPPDTAIAMISTVERRDPDLLLVSWAGRMTLCVGAADEKTLEDEATVVDTVAKLVARAMGVLSELLDVFPNEVGEEDGEIVEVRIVPLEAPFGGWPGDLDPGTGEGREELVSGGAVAVVALNMVDENDSDMVKVLSKNDKVECKGNRTDQVKEN